MPGFEETFRLKDENGTSPELDRFDALRQTAFSLRADLKSYEMQKMIAEQQVKYARGAFWPTVGLYAVYNAADQNPATVSLVRESILAGASLNFPFFEGGLRVAELREAQAKERQARLAYDDLKKNIDVELRGAYLDLETQQGACVSRGPARLRQDNYNAVLRQYENGWRRVWTSWTPRAALVGGKKRGGSPYGWRLAYLKVRKSSGTLLTFVLDGV